MLKPLTSKDIDRLATFGAYVSKWCRHPWTGEQTMVSVPVMDIAGGGGKGGRALAVTLEYMSLMVYENVADLNQYRLARYGQHSWLKADWEREIRKFSDQADAAREKYATWKHTRGWQPPPTTGPGASRG